MSSTILKSYNPATGEALDAEYRSNSLEDLEASVASATEAFSIYGKTTGEERSEFLEAIASEIESIVDDLVNTATQETGLPAARIQGETGRIVGQLRLFASIAKEGSWVHYHDNGQVERKGTYRDGEREGSWVFIEKDGTKRNTSR